VCSACRYLPFWQRFLRTCHFDSGPARDMHRGGLAIVARARLLSYVLVGPLALGRGAGCLAEVVRPEASPLAKDGFFFCDGFASNFWAGIVR